MKFILLFASAVIAMSYARAAEAKAAMQETSEVFVAPITKVYSLQEGDRRFIAYVVSWRQQEVIAMPLSRGSQYDDFAIGDVVWCLKHEIAPAAGGVPRLAFTVVGSAKEPAASDSNLLRGEEQARLEAQQVEIARRRADREASAAKSPSNSDRAKQAPAPAPMSVASPDIHETRRP